MPALRERSQREGAPLRMPWSAEGPPSSKSLMEEMVSDEHWKHHHSKKILKMELEDDAWARHLSIRQAEQEQQIGPALHAHSARVSCRPSVGDAI